MRVLVHEQGFRGHHFHYLGYILPPLVDLVDEVVVATTREAADTREYHTFIGPLADRLDFRPILGLERPYLTVRDRIALAEELRATIRQFRPDYVLATSGDGASSGLGLLRPIGRGGLPGGVPGEVAIHFGYGLKETGPKNRFKDQVYLRTQQLSPWKKLHYVSATNYEYARKHGGPLARRAELLPHPVPPSPRHSKEESRRRLGLPEDGRYIGLAAVLDCRKGIPELLEAFARAAGPDDRLLMAGQLDEGYAQLIDERYGELVRRGQLIVRAGFYDEPTGELILGALDAVCTAYPRFGQLSATMLNGIAAGKPVLVNDFGWMGWMVRRFGFGWTCDVHDPESYASAIRRALDEAPSYRESEATRRLLEFHAPGNFARAWLRGIREAIGRPDESGYASWPWVLEALDRAEAMVGSS